MEFVFMWFVESKSIKLMIAVEHDVYCVKFAAI